MRSLFLALWLSLAVSLSGCAKPEAPHVTPTEVRVGAVGPAGLELLVALDVHNPNSFALRAQSVEGALVLGSGAELGRGSSTPERPIPAKGSASIVSTLNIPWTNIGALLPLVTSEQPVPYRFVGSAKIGGERLNVSVPFELKGQLTQAELLQIGMRGLAPGVPQR